MGSNPYRGYIEGPTVLARALCGACRYLSQCVFDLVFLSNFFELILVEKVFFSCFGPDFLPEDLTWKLRRWVCFVENFQG